MAQMESNLDRPDQAPNVGAKPYPSLRAYFDAQRAIGQPLPLSDAVAIVVPLCLELKELHSRGVNLFVYPSCIAFDNQGTRPLPRIIDSLAIEPPPDDHDNTHAFDRACIAPELVSQRLPGDARASVFALGAILYEAVTNAHVGPAMARPRVISPNLPPTLEFVLEKALIANPDQRPDDLGALASALYNLAPERCIHPPDVANSEVLEQHESIEIDTTLSMLPPEPPVPTIPRPPSLPDMDPKDPFAQSKRSQVSSASKRSDPNDPYIKLASLKAQLEADPRHRYVVIKERMDHGPFTAVELLQQIANHAFTLDDDLRDHLSGQTRLIKEWEEFAPFAEAAVLNRKATEERKEVARIELEEKKAGLAKSTITLILTGIAIGFAGLWLFQVRGMRQDTVSVIDDPRSIDLTTDGGIRGRKRPTPPSGGPGAGGGAVGPGGMSYEAAIASNNQEVTIGGKNAPDLTDAQLNGPMKHASFVSGCGAPNDMKVTVRVAIKLGRAVGVTVTTSPVNPAVASCIDHAVRGLSWPSNPKMDSFTTIY